MGQKPGYIGWFFCVDMQGCSPQEVVAVLRGIADRVARGDTAGMQDPMFTSSWYHFKLIECEEDLLSADNQL